MPNILKIKPIDNWLKKNNWNYYNHQIETLKLSKGKGCDKCNGTGYKGRQGIYEILEVNSALAAAIIEGKRAPELLEIAKENGFKTMDQVARDHIKNGVITYEEFVRTISMQN